MTAAVTHGIVALAALDVRRAPRHRAEMGSQLLLGEVVRLRDRSANAPWRRIENLTDGYRGWVRAWGLTLVNARAAAAWRRRARARVVVPWAQVLAGPGVGAPVSPLFWGCRVIPGLRSGRHRAVALPDGRRGWITARALATGVKSRVTLETRARELLGVPYLWGGRTPAGLDCSGLSQMLLAEQGHRLPRDAGDQERVCRPIKHERPMPGDLAFFGAARSPAGHVGVMLGPSLYVHARGLVRVNSLDPVNRLYDSELSAGFRSVRRPPKPGFART